MPQMRFLGPETVYVTPLGRSVEPDESVDVPDELVWRAPTVDDKGETTDEGNLTGYVWPEDLWSEVGGTRRRSTEETKPARKTSNNNTTEE